MVQGPGKSRGPFLGLCFRNQDRTFSRIINNFVITPPLQKNPDANCQKRQVDCGF